MGFICSPFVHASCKIFIRVVIKNFWQIINQGISGFSVRILNRVDKADLFDVVHSKTTNHTLIVRMSGFMRENDINMSIY